MSDTLIKVEGVSKKFCRSLKKSLWYGLQDIGNEMIGKRHGGHGELRTDEFWAVKDVGFELKRGECLGLIGHNGAGKTTLLRILNGLINPDEGRVELRGTVGAMIALGAGFNPILTGRENIYVAAAVRGMDKQYVDSKIDEIIDFAEISESINAPVQTYSSGMNVRLGFAVASILIEPSILLIDEVLAVGDLGFIIKCLNRMGELIPKTATIFVSHSMPMMARVSTKTMLMNRGNIDFYSNDIAEGIMQYTNMFNAPERMNQGTGEIELLRIGIKNPLNKKFEQNKTVALETFDDLIIEATIEIKSSIADFEFFVTMFDGQLREALSSSSSSFCEPFSNKGDNIRTFEIKIPKLVLSTGRYSITFGTIDSKTKHIYCRVINSISFTVKAIQMNWATSYVPGEWKELKTKGLDERPIID